MYNTKTFHMIYCCTLSPLSISAANLLSMSSYQSSRGQAAASIQRCRLTSIGVPMLKIRRPHDRPIFNLGIPIPGKDGLYIETGPRFYLTRSNVSVGTLSCIRVLSHIRGFLGDQRLWRSLLSSVNWRRCSHDASNELRWPSDQRTSMPSFCTWNARISYFLPLKFALPITEI